MLTIISPSKTQEIGNVHCKEYTTPQFLNKCQKLVEELQQFSVEELGQIMATSTKLSGLTHERLADFDFPPLRQKCGQALLTFQGDVFSAIATENYSIADLTFAQNHLRILSGLYGVLRPLDLIQPYRLEMGSKFKAEPDTSLYQFWREEVTSSINESLSTIKAPILLNLASGEYTKVIEKKKLQAPIVNVSFKQWQNGKLRTIAIYAKRARGAMVDFIIRKRLEKPRELQSFNYDGYLFNKESSTDTELLFIR